MSRDKKGGGVKRPRMVQRPQVPPGPLRKLKDLLYEVYSAAQPKPPSLDEIAADIADDDTLDGAPSRDTAQRILGTPAPGDQADVVAIAAVLARRAAWSEADIVQQVRKLWVEARMVQRAGKPISDFTAFDLEVHPVIEIESKADGTALPPLPPYVRRDHDERLHRIVAEAGDGASRLVMLVGGSSTGKTRACWEAVHGLPKEWRLWHPIAPTQPEAALAGLEAIGPRTVVWLNEAQCYLHTPDGLGERVAAGLRELLRDSGRGPVLILGTIRSDYWDALTAPSQLRTSDPHAQARALLSGSAIDVPESFSGPELDDLRVAADCDPRLAYAVQRAEQGHITQFLAGAPALLERYRTAPPAAKALIEAAMDARRLGHSLDLPLPLLKAAAEGYLTDVQWDLLNEEWLEQSLQYTKQSLRGVRGPLTRVRRRSGQPVMLHPQYRLSDYLEEQGRAERRYAVPPTPFWDAAARHARTPSDLMTLADAARERWLLRQAAVLYRAAADAGEARAWVHLGTLHVRAGDPPGAALFYRAAAHAGDARGLVHLGLISAQAGAADEALRLFQAAAEQAADTADPSEADYYVGAVALQLWKFGDADGAERLCLALAEAGGDHPWLWAQLAQLRMAAEDWDGAEPHARRAAAGSKGDFNPMWELIQAWRSAGCEARADGLREDLIATSHTETLWEMAETKGFESSADRIYSIIDERAGHTPLGWTIRASRLEAAGDISGAETLYRKCVNARFRGATGDLARLRMRAEDWDEAERYALLAAAENRHDMAAHDLAMTYKETGQIERLRNLYQRLADGGDEWGFLGLARLMDGAGDRTGAEAVALKAVAAGHSTILFMLRNRDDDPRWRQLLRYGLEPDGRVSRPWSAESTSSPSSCDR